MTQPSEACYPSGALILCRARHGRCRKCLAKARIVLKFLEVAAKAAFRTKNDGFDCRQAAIEALGDFGVAHPFVIAQHERYAVVVGKQAELFADLALGFRAQHLGKRRGRHHIRDNT